jgi:ABC-type polar amino acid transport system ATPase subunit
VLQVTGISLNRGERAILTSVSFDAHRGELIALMGPSGSGKTTILRAIAGLERIEFGEIIVGDARLEPKLAGPALKALRRQVGLVFQFHHLFEHMSVMANICLAPVHAHGVAPEDARRRGRELLRSLGIEHRADALPRELSGGEAQRAAIARALAVDPPLLLMDEPTASLDPPRRAELSAILKRLIAEGRTLIVATHDEEFARSSATRVLRLHDGALESSVVP